SARTRHLSHRSGSCSSSRQRCCLRRLPRSTPPVEQPPPRLCNRSVTPAFGRPGPRGLRGQGAGSACAPAPTQADDDTAGSLRKEGKKVEKEVGGWTKVPRHLSTNGSCTVWAT